MKLLITDTDFTKIGFYKTILEQDGIPVFMKNEYASMAMGSLPFTDVWPELWIMDDDDYEKAKEILKEYFES
jgi:hypothetical protein